MARTKPRSDRRDGNTAQGDKRGKRRRSEPETTRRVRKKVCQFCRDRVESVDYKEVGQLRRYMSDRAKIRSRRVTGNCPRHQREVARAIKLAREMALLSYTGRP